MKTQQKGQRGEQLALELLTAKGYELQVRNYRAGRGEIDLIFQKDELLIFVEVKYRSSDSFGLPEETLKEAQQELIRRTAEAYLDEIDWEDDLRFDVVAILEKKGQNPEMEHFEDAF